MRIEIASLSDIDSLTRLNSHVQGLHVRGAPHFFKASSVQEVATSFEEYLRQENASGFIAYVEDKAVGYLLARVRERSGNAFLSAQTWMYIDQVSVEPDFQGQGVGRGLMDAVLRYAREKGIREFEVETWVFNHAAQEFFASFGFQPKTIQSWLSDQS